MAHLCGAHRRLDARAGNNTRDPSQFSRRLKTRLTVADIIRMPRPLQGSVAIVSELGTVYILEVAILREDCPIDLRCDWIQSAI